MIGTDTSIAGVLTVTHDFNVDGYTILNELNLKTNIASTLQKTAIGVETFAKIDSKLRIVTGTDGHVKIQYGDIITNAMQDMGSFYLNTTTNKGNRYTMTLSNQIHQVL